jgi:drug/metabolite transporter (DMT)-like permease
MLFLMLVALCRGLNKLKFLDYYILFLMKNNSLIKNRSSWTNIFLLFGAGGTWGFQFLFNKIALTGFPTPLIATLRVFLGALTLFLVLIFLKGEASPPGSQRSFWGCFGDFLLIGVIEAALPALLVPWAQQRIASSVAAVLMGTIPLFTTLLEFFFVRGTQLTVQRCVGVAAGFVGVIILMAPSLKAEQYSANFRLGAGLLPAGAVLLASFSFAVAMLLTKNRLTPHLGPITAAKGILLGGGLVSLPFLFWAVPLQSFGHLQPSLGAVAAVLGLGVFCSGAAYTFFVMLINHAGPSFASMSNYLVPLVGAVLGIFFAGEHVTFSLIGALLVIFFSLWLSGAEPAPEG